MLSGLSTQRIRVQKISRWAIAPVVDARTVAIAIRLILKLDVDEALSSFQKRKQITEPEAHKPGLYPSPPAPLPEAGRGEQNSNHGLSPLSPKQSRSEARGREMGARPCRSNLI